MPQPFEIIAAPITLYSAPTGSAFPDLNDVVPAPWTLIGTSGDRNYEESGVSATHDQTIEPFTMLGGPGIRKVGRTNES